MQWFNAWLLAAPLWQIGLVAFGGMVAGSFAGGALRRRHDRISASRGPGDSKQNDELGLMGSAVLGLLALLVAFTFSIALDRFDTRRTNVLNEANAIGTTYLRAQLLDEPHRARLSRLLGEFTDTRVALAMAQPGPKRTNLLANSDRLLADMWTATVSALPSMRAYPYSGAFLETMNNMIDMDAVRKAGRQAHVPSAVFLVLLIYQFIAAGVVGYVVAERAGRGPTWVLFVLLGVMMILIIDVDRPTTGGVTESQEPMLQLQSFLKDHPPAAFDRFSLPVASAGVMEARLARPTQ